MLKLTPLSVHVILKEDEMIQGLLAIILLALAVCFYFWGRRGNERPVPEEDPNVVLGLAESTPKTVPVPVPVPTKKPTMRQLLFLRAAAGNQYSGYELLQSLLSCGMRLGEDNIFHRYEQRADEQVVLFSIAAATQSGIFNLSEMGNFSCLGLSLFITLNDHLYPSVNFELMLDTVRQLVEDLGGQILE